MARFGFRAASSLISGGWMFAVQFYSIQELRLGLQEGKELSGAFSIQKARENFRSANIGHHRCAMRSKVKERKPLIILLL